ncbi:hypothetical protein PYW08_015588 [Mythimna loreyi]|uniref:Uncharacterized protein n=1 Tax=Mythimna loreyi TaxID=667449 RepID=A0ACC2QW99_9NEOP|nr:hypothetical protein PYW08_015588 [Mythimna loreyi]
MLNAGCSGSGNCSSQPATSLDSQLVRCPHCAQARYFKGERGLKIHYGKVHKPHSVPLCLPAPSQTPTHSESIWKTLSKLKNSTPVLKRVPRGARRSVALSLARCVRLATQENTQSAWEDLLTFPYRILHVQKRLASKTLTTQIKDNCNNSADILDRNLPPFNVSQKGLNSHVESKLNDGDISGAARLLFSSDVVAPYSPDTISALESKHPAPADDLTFPDPPDRPIPDSQIFPILAPQLLAAVSSFRSGSAGGLDGLTPQHLKDLLSSGAGDAGESLLKELLALVTLMLSGGVNDAVVDVLYGANLCALRKRDGGIRPIAVGCTYRRMAAKICCRLYGESLTKKFQPLQLGFGSRGGCEAAVHALSTYLNSKKGEVILKVDVKNAFNSVNRDTLLAEAKKALPEIFGFLWQCYRHPSKLLYKDNVLESAVGCQQGDPLGPAIFSLAIHPIIQQLNSKFNVWYLDDGTLGGDVDTVLEDFQLLKQQFKSIGLDLNESKCELFISDSTDRLTTLQKFYAIAPEIKILDKSSLRLLGSPILEDGFSSFIDDKIERFNNISERLTKINLHSAFTLIRYCCFAPNFMYFLRSSPLWKQPHLLDKIDQTIRHTLTSILNVALDDRAWLQATLPIRFGGLGIRKITSVSLPAFLSSVRSTQQLTSGILTQSLVDCEVPCLTDALSAWKLACPDEALPENPSSQRQWDEPLCRLVRNNLINTSTNTAERARLLAVGEWESGLWLQTLPSPNIGSMLSDTTFRIATCLRLGAPSGAPHRCQCGEVVDRLGHHGLSCSRSAGRIARHASINDIIRRALVTAGVPAVLEPNGLARDDGKRPDGMTIMPWKLGRPLVWDATCVDTLAPSHLLSTAGCAGAAAASAENLKRRKYNNLIGSYMFEPFGVETLGPWGPSAHRVVRDISKQLVDSSRDQRAGLYFCQRISIAIQRGNAASVLGTFPIDIDVDEFFDAQ